MKFSIRLKELRAGLGLTQKEMAKKLNIASSTIAMYEVDKREPDFETTLNIANYFGVSLDYLMGRTDNLKETATLKEQEKNPMQQAAQDIIDFGKDNEYAFTPQELIALQILDKMSNEEKEKQFSRYIEETSFTNDGRTYYRLIDYFDKEELDLLRKIMDATQEQKKAVKTLLDHALPRRK